MGACTFGQWGRPGEKDPVKAYREVWDEARHMHGADGYNGTISTTNGVKVVQAKPVHKDQIHDIVDPILDPPDGRSTHPDIEKWQKAGAIAVAGADGHSFHRWYFFGWAAE